MNEERIKLVSELTELTLSIHTTVVNKEIHRTMFPPDVPEFTYADLEEIIIKSTRAYSIVNRLSHPKLLVAVREQYNLANRLLRRTDDAEGYKLQLELNTQSNLIWSEIGKIYELTLSPALETPVPNRVPQVSPKSG